MIATGAKVIKIVKPYRDKDLIFEKLAEAERNGAFAVGMDIDFVFGGSIEDSLIRPELMGPKTLDDIRDFVKATGLPFILKGVLSAQDAQKSLDAGASAIVVSHHGGSVLDYAVPPLKILPHIVKVTKGKIPVFVDSGITRGSDVFKALAIGADGVLVGRSLLAGHAVSGEEGAVNILKGTTEELRRIMSLTASRDLGQIDPEVLWNL